MRSYIRVNTLKTNVDSVQKALLPLQAKPHQHISTLLVLPPHTNLHGHALVKSGHVFVQDLASCLPVACIPDPSRHRVALDACAAPVTAPSQTRSQPIHQQPL